jgi:PQQ-dependent dehydrogenase (methanol/ethanol family)
MKWLLLGVPGIVLFTVMTIALQTQTQTRRVNDDALKNAPKGTEWLSHGMGWSEQRYTTMTQINPQNVKNLKLDWSYEIGPGNGAGQKTNPLYANGVLYGVTNWSVVYAVDAKTGKQLWQYDPVVDAAMRANPGQRLCCGVNSRGIALYEGKVFVAVLDGRIQALDATTGKMLWSSWAIPEPKPGEISSYSLTMAPRVAKGKVFIGNAGAEFPPFRGYLAAFDVNTGKELWKFYMTPGDPSKGFENKAMEAAAKTWAGKWWEQGGGGSMWDGMAYDPDENLVYIGTGNGATWAADVRNGGRQPQFLDNLYIASIVAINADNGQYKWHYQTTPGDQWDYDAIQHLLLADIRINNQNRKVIMQANKNGYFYVIDRTNGQFISASEMAPVSWARGIDPKTGKVDFHPDALYSAEKGVTVHPVQMHTTSQMSFNPNTGLVYLSIASDGQFSFIASAQPYAPTPGRQNFGMGSTRGAGVTLANPPVHGPVRKNPDGSAVRGGILSAWDPATQTERWFALGGGQTSGGTLSTASNLVFQTQTNGTLRVFTADKGELLHEMRLPLTAGTGSPITYMLDGKQYIAVVAGTTGAAAGGRGGGAGGGGRGGGPGGPGAPGAPGAPAPAPQQEPTAAAAQRGNTPAPAPAPATPATNNNPKLFVYSLPN